MQRTLIELENRYKNENGRLKKKYETDQQDFVLQIDVLNRNNADLAKNNKALSTRVKVRIMLLSISFEFSLAYYYDILLIQFLQLNEKIHIL